MNRPATDEEMDRTMQGIDDVDLVVCDKINSRHEQQRKLGDIARWASTVIYDPEVDDSLESIDVESNFVYELEEVGVGEAFDE